MTANINTEVPTVTDTGETEDIIRYIYQHTIFDEMPYTLYSESPEHNVIYCYDTDYIGHSIYEDVSKTMQLFNEIEKLQSDVFMDSHLQNLVNIGCPQNDNDETSVDEAHKELYNVEQNKILHMNIESPFKDRKIYKM